MEKKSSPALVSDELLAQVECIASHVNNSGLYEYVYIQNFEIVLKNAAKPLHGFDPEFVAALVYK